MNRKGKDTLQKTRISKTKKNREILTRDLTVDVALEGPGPDAGAGGTVDLQTTTGDVFQQQQEQERRTQYNLQRPGHLHLLHP